MANYKKNLKIAKKIIFLAVCALFLNQNLPYTLAEIKNSFTQYGRGPVVLAIKNNTDNESQNIDDHSEDFNNEQKLADQQPVLNSSLPGNNNLPYYETYITATAYTSRPEETDDTPFIAAWGDHVYWGMLASNALPRGTKIQIPDHFGEKIFSIADTMNKRYHWRLDIWMPELQSARDWGAKYVKIRIFK